MTEVGVETQSPKSKAQLSHFKYVYHVKAVYLLKYSLYLI